MSEALTMIALISVIIILVKYNKNKKSISSLHKQVIKQPIRRKQPTRQPAQSSRAEKTITQEAPKNDFHAGDYDGRYMQDAIKYRDLAREAFKEGRNNDAWKFYRFRRK